jgi:hypothetical protein
MARKIVHQLVDDLDGTVLEPGEGETVLFSLDGIAYEIDVTDENAAELRQAFTKYVDAARRVSGGSSAGARAGRGRRRSAPSNNTSEVREWAKANGHEVSERGRISASVQEAYDAAH